MKVAIVVVSRVGLSIIGNKEFEYMASINFQLEDEQYWNLADDI